MELNEVHEVRCSPPPKRQKLEGPGAVEDGQPLRCSTPQPPGGEETGEDLDSTLESLGLSQDSVDIFIDETGVGGLTGSSRKVLLTSSTLDYRQESAPTYSPDTQTGTECLDFFGVNGEYAEQFLSDVEEESAGRGRVSSVGGIPEVMEVILGQLPISQLYCVCRLVCRKWNAIIQREKFLYWKKMYFKYKSGRCSSAAQRVASLTDELWPGGKFEHPSLATVTMPLVRFVSEKFCSMAVGQEAMRDLLSHPQSHCVVRIRELCPNINSKKGSSDIVTVVLLVMCSSSVREVLTIAGSLLKPHSLLPPPCERLKVLELFYCLATLFCVYTERLGMLPMRLHYHVFYALNVLERGPSSVPATELVSHSASGRQTQFRHCIAGSREGLLTAEQLQIVNYSIQPGEVIKVMAFAGTGKTTTVLQFTTLHPRKSFLYCVYNKSVQVHASSVFPKNVKCQTFHSLAHGRRGDNNAVGWKYLSKRGNLSSYLISQWVDSERIKESLVLLSKQILQTLEKFIASSDDEIDDDHVPCKIRLGRNSEMDTEEYHAKMRLVNEPKYRALVLREASGIWEKMVDLGNKTVKMTDDGYLKLFQLTRPQITGYNCILVDEAQDLTPAIVSLISSQACSKMFVGDTHQQIYGFRGATNALECIRADRVFYLTESFRFGPEIAYVAACTLSTLKGVWRQTLVGSTHEGRIDGVKCGQVAVIARMNATLFNEMVKVVRGGRQLKLGFAGGIQKYEFDMYLDLHKLQQGKTAEIQNKFVKRWHSFQALSNYADRTDDVALINKIKICERYSTELPALIGKIKSMHSRNMSSADIVFSTAHKSKGLEFDTVELTNDYNVFVDDDSHRSSPSSVELNRDLTEEWNLLYVAVTRAKKSLILTPTLVRVLKEAKEYFVYPTMDDSALSEGLCSVCLATNPYPPLHLRQGGRRVTSTMMVCTACAALTLPFLLHKQKEHTCTCT